MISLKSEAPVAQYLFRLALNSEGVAYLMSRDDIQKATDEFITEYLNQQIDEILQNRGLTEVKIKPTTEIHGDSLLKAEYRDEYSNELLGLLSVIEHDDNTITMQMAHASPQVGGRYEEFDISQSGVKHQKATVPRGEMQQTLSELEQWLLKQVEDEG